MATLRIGSRVKMLIKFLFFLSIFTYSNSQSTVEDLTTKIGNGIKELLNYETSAILNEAIEEYKEIADKNVAKTVFCDTCEKVVTEIIKYRRKGAGRQNLKIYLEKICPIVTNWPQVVCSGHIDIELDSLIYIIDNKRDLTAARVCSIIFQQKNCKDNRRNEWTIEMWPSSVGKNRILQKKKNSNYEKPLKILHLTDIHYDPEYVAASNADCGLPLCCQDFTPNKQNGNFVPAGFWSDYHFCDMPWYTITNLMKHLTAEHGEDYFDLIYYTGDIISHKSWATSKERNEQAITELYRLLASTFKNTTVYPILGNHEAHPANFYSPIRITNPLVSTTWTLELAAREWATWLPTYTQQTIKSGGFYTVAVKPGFRIIALNSNVCFTSNYWLVFDDEDPYGQLLWFAEVLRQAEENNEVVHILSHIPPGEPECLQQWSLQFRKIIERFAHIIPAQFNGHTHLDEFRAFYDTKDENGKVINVAYNGGSFTTFVGNNPNYRIYSVDPQTMQVLDFDQYIYNVTEANQNNSTAPRWFKYYSFKEAYDMENLTPDDFTQLLSRLSSNETLKSQYYRFQTRGSEAQNSNICDDDCLNRLICHVKAVEAEEALACDNY